MWMSGEGNRGSRQGQPYLQQQVVFEDSLDGLEQVGAQRERALQGGLAVPEELGQGLAPHAVCEGRHGAGGQPIGILH